MSTEIPAMKIEYRSELSYGSLIHTMTIYPLTNNEFVSIFVEKTITVNGTIEPSYVRFAALSRLASDAYQFGQAIMKGCEIAAKWDTNPDNIIAIAAQYTKTE